MASTRVPLQISGLDFDAIKLSIQNYLSSQSQFTDYNFEGSGLSVILNILSYNTNYLSYYLNMVANEMFLDSADRRENIVSIAKSLGYTPRSRKSAQALVNIIITPPSSPPPPAIITIEKYTKFNSNVNGKVYTFVTNQATSVNYDSMFNRYVGSNVTLNEGTPFTFRYTVNTTADQRYIIPNSGVDTNTITVRVQASSQNSAMTVFTLSENITEIGPTTPVYFLQEVENEQYEIQFGDGILGLPLQNGNIVYIDYIACNADAPNFANLFTVAGTINGYGNVIVTTLNPAAGGAEREDQESVRFTAPKNYQTQNRAVTAEDYKNIITKNYPNVASVAIWGGQDNVPPQYGKVFLSLKPVSGYVITNLTKQTIISQILQPRNIVSVIPEFVDPDFIFVTVNSLVKYDSQNTSNTADQIKALVISVIQNFAVVEIGQFESILRYSKLTGLIDGAESSITNNLTLLQIQKRFTPSLITANNYILMYENAIVPGTLFSSAFIDNSDPSYISGNQYFFDDDSAGKLRIYKINGSLKIYTKNNAGTVDYTTGTINITNFKPSDVVDTTKILKLTATPVSNDIVPVRNNIIVIDDADITVNLQVNTPLI